MASSYPGALDTLTNPVAADTLDSVTVPHATQHANANDAIEAVQAELGVDPAGASATVVARLDTLDTTVAAKVANPMTAALNANSNTIYSVSQFAVGATITTTNTVTVARTASITTGYNSLSITDSITWGSGSFLVYTGFRVGPTLTFNVAPLGVTLMVMSPTLAGTATGYPVTGVQSSLAPPAGSALSKWTAMQLAGGRAADTVLTVGLDIGVTTALAGTTVWGIQCADYQSYHTGRISLGGSTAPTYALDIKGTAQDRGVIALAESSATPTNPSSSNQALIYLKADKLVLAFNDAGTVRYKYLDLTGTGVTWVHTTTAP